MLIDLDDTIWSELRHAYGNASSIPQTLREMYSGDDVADEKFLGFTNAVSHQGSVYNASFAAFPHLVKIGISAGRYHEIAFSIAEIILYDALSGDGGTLPTMSDRLHQGFMYGLAMGRAYLSKQLELEFLNSSDPTELYLLRRISLFRMRPRVTMLLDTVSRNFQCPLCRETIENPIEALCPFPYSK